MPFDVLGRSRFVKPPPGAAPIADHPLTAGLKAAYLFNGTLESVISNAQLSPNTALAAGLPSFVQGAYGGYALRLNGDCGLQSPRNQNWIPAIGNEGCACVAIVRPQLAATANICQIGSPTVTSSSGIFQLDSGGTFSFLGGSTTVMTSTATSGTYAVGEVNHLAWSRKTKLGGVAAKYAEVYRNGRQVSQATTAAATAISNTPPTITVGVSPAGANFYTGTIEALYLWNRPLTYSEAVLLYTQPFCFLRHPSQVRYFFADTVAPPAGDISGSTTLTFSQSGAATGAGALAGSSTLAFSSSTTLTGAGALAASATMTFGSSSALTGGGALLGSSTLVFDEAGIMTGTGALAASATLTFSQSALLSGSGALAASTSFTFDQSGTLSVVADLSGSTSFLFTCSATGSRTPSIVGMWAHPVVSRSINATRINAGSGRVQANASMPRIELDGDTDIDPPAVNERIEAEG